MKLVKWLGLATSLILLSPVTVEAYQTPIEDKEVDVVELVEHFSGIHELMNSTDGVYYDEYIFDGHIIQVYNGQSVAWLDGKVTPFRTAKVEGVLVPQSYKVRTSMRDTKLPVEFFVEHFGYSIDGDQLVFDEKPIKVEEVEEIELEQPEIDVVVEDDEPTDITEEEDNTSPIVSDGEEKDELVDEEQKEDEQPVESKPEELGNLAIDIDLKDVPLDTPETSKIVKVIDGHEFTFDFQSEASMSISLKGQDKTKTVNYIVDKKQTITFEINNGDYYTLDIEIKDTRKPKLTTEVVWKRVKDIHPEIVMNSGNGEIKLTYESPDMESVRIVLDDLERLLVELDIKRFSLDSDDNNFKINFNLFD